MAVLPLPSVTVHVTVVVPNGNAPGALFVTLATLQLSAVTGVPRNTPVAVHPLLVQAVALAGAVIVGLIISGALVTVTAAVVAVQLLSSFTVTVYVPAPTAKVLPGWKAPPLRLYCNVPVPPEAVTVRVVVPPQATVPADADAVIAVG